MPVQRHQLLAGQERSQRKNGIVGSRRYSASRADASRYVSWITSEGSIRPRSRVEPQGDHAEEPVPVPREQGAQGLVIALGRSGEPPPGFA